MRKTARTSPLSSATIGLLAVFLFLIAILGLLGSPRTSAPAAPSLSPLATETPLPAETPLPTPTQTLSPQVVSDLKNCAALLALAQAGVEGAAEQILPTIQDPYLCAQVATPAARLAIPDLIQPPAQEKPKDEAPTPNGFDLANKLGQLGLPDKAFENYSTAVVKEPDHPSVEALKSQPWAFWKRLTTWFSFYQPLTGILAVLLLFLLARWAIFAWANGQIYSMDIATFSREGVKLTPEDFDPSNLLAAEIERGLIRLKSAGKHRDLSLIDSDLGLIDSDLGLIDGPLADLDLNNDIAPLPAEVGKVLTFLLKFIPKKQVTVSGYLSFEPDAGAILAVRMIKEEPRAKVVHATRAFRQADFEPDYQVDGSVPQVEAYLRLAEVATPWISNKKYRLDHQDRPDQEIDQKLFEAYGTLSDRSIGLNQLAVKWIKVEKYDRREKV